MCCLYVKLLFIPNDISTLTARLDYSEIIMHIDVVSVIVDAEVAPCEL